MSSPRLLAITSPSTLPGGACWREVRTPQQTIGFVLLRSQRRSIGLQVNDNGLQIRAPKWVSLAQIDAVVIQREDWILAKLHLRQQRQDQHNKAATLWETGGIVPYMGARLVLALDHQQKKHTFQGQPFHPVDGDSLVLALPDVATSEQIRENVNAWLQHQAKLWFDQRLQHFLDVGQLHMQRWRLSSAATRWGSCSSKGNIMLNWRLIHFKHPVIDYVIAHEVAHLREMNHSKNFWHEVERLLPDFGPARDALRQHNPASLPLL